jgi:superfamily I DNA/RNA helicase
VVRVANLVVEKKKFNGREKPMMKAVRVSHNHAPVVLYERKFDELMRSVEKEIRRLKESNSNMKYNEIVILAYYNNDL